MGDDEQNVSKKEENTGMTTKSIRRLLSNKKIMIIAAVVLVILIIVIIVIVVFLAMKDGGRPNKFAAKAKAKCEEYAQLACTQESGKPKLDDSGRIWRGREPDPGIVPYMAYIESPWAIVDTCTGTLISEWFVMTAASSFYGYDGKSSVSGYLAVVFKPDRGPPSFTSSKIYFHDKYNKSGRPEVQQFEGNIVLLKTSKKVILSASVRPICLNTKLENTAGDFISAGYSRIERIEGDVPVDQPSIRLRMVEMRMDGEVQKKCNQQYNFEGFTRKIICAAHPTERKGAAYGDAGGPLMYPLKHKCPNVHEQIGVLSLEKQTHELHNRPLPLIFLYDKVEYYIEWIVKIVWPDPN